MHHSSTRCEAMLTELGVEWHPIHHNIFASGDSSGAIIYWSLLSPDPSEPVTVLEAAHEDAVFTLSFHPLGHILCSGSKDFTARFWCRARPTGGHETDRWHIGEEKALGAKMEEELGERVSKRVRVDDEGVLPGLSNFVAPPNGDSYPSKSSASVPGLNSLPGFGGAPVRQWGAASAVDGTNGFPRSQGPLPSQDEMLRKTVGVEKYEDRRGGGGGGYAGGQGGYGGGRGANGGGQNGYGEGGAGGYGSGGRGGYR